MPNAQVTPGTRSEVKSRYYRTFTYREVDRVPDVEFGYWPQTIRRWLKEGLPEEMVSEQNAMFSAKMDRFFGFDDELDGSVTMRVGMNPSFKHKVIEEKKDSTVVRDGSGATYEHFPGDSDDSSIPHYISFPVQTPADWEAMKQRFRVDDPVRDVDVKEVERARKAMAEGALMSSGGSGPYGQLRAWMGFENLSYAFYEHPAMVHEMVERWTELYLRTLDQLPADIVIDHFSWWEDMASRNGPFVSPDMFREFLQPCYHEVMEALKKRGCILAIVDCDGNPHDIVANWLEEGVNIMFPLEVQAGVDPYAWREEFGMELRLRGGVAKEPLVEGGSAIDRELERLKPLLEQGGFIPHLDHLVPPDISYKNYCEYLEQKRKMIGKE